MSGILVGGGKDLIQIIWCDLSYIKLWPNFFSTREPGVNLDGLQPSQTLLPSELPSTPQPAIT